MVIKKPDTPETLEKMRDGGKHLAQTKKRQKKPVNPSPTNTFEQRNRTPQPTNEGGRVLNDGKGKNMDKEHIRKILRKGITVKINLKTGIFYNATIDEVGDSSIIITDKYGDKIIIDFDAIDYITSTNGGGC